MYFATSNENKVREANRVLRRYGIEVVPLRVKKLELQSPSLSEISLFAARHAYIVTRLPVFVEDSGLFVEALNGFPGPYSNYVFRTLGVKGILKLMSRVSNRRAWFESAVAIVLPPYEKVFVGRVYGKIAEQARGSGGFGFDPIFIPEGESRTFGEMDIDEKNRLSHRALALVKLGEWLKSSIAQFKQALQAT